MSYSEFTEVVFANLKWTADGLVPAIVQDAETGEVLMMAWMDRAGPAPDARDRPDAFLLAVAPGGVAQGRDFGPRPARRGDLGRLRRRRAPDQGQPGRRGVPRGVSLLLLPASIDAGGRLRIDCRAGL